MTWGGLNFDWRRVKRYYFKIRKEVIKMNYESIANMVHDLIKNPKSMLSLEHGLSWGELNKNESAIIQTVFSKYEVSGDVLTPGTLPLGFWG